MAEELKEAKQFDEMADEVLAKLGKETPEGTSPSDKPEGEEAEKTETSGAEPEKTDKVKAIEEDSSLSVEEKIAKIKEILGDDEKAIDAYVKSKGYHQDPAWQKQRELIEKLKKDVAVKTELSEENMKALADFKEFRSSAEYIQQSMKSKGFTQEAIDKELQKAGFEVKAKPQDDVDLVIGKLGVKLDEMGPDEKANTLVNISDISKIVNIILEDRFSKVLPKELAPIQERIMSMDKSENANKLLESIKTTVKDEGILDFDKDITPALNKFLDDSPDATQQDLSEQFKILNHKLTIERLKLGKNKAERDEKKETFRQNIPISSGLKNLPKKTGNFEKDSESFFETVQVE